MAKSATRIASELLSDQADRIEVLRIHVFEDDEEAHDDELIEELYDEFVDDFERMEVALSKKYGSPLRSGEHDDDGIPSGGVFRFSLWQINDRVLFLAASHEDREIPIVLELGTAPVPKKATVKKSSKKRTTRE